ncbi:MAG: LysR family transcriptional regulator [Actinomycetota bacterium]|nr:LysR family transcriptional regulator [Actinomycetota bacterium]
MPIPLPVPDVVSLDLLRSVAELGSIRQAAAAHGVSQPAASMRLRSLEAALRVELLDRSSGRARLTAAGVAVVGWSESVLDAVRTLVAGTEALRAEGRTQLRIAASMTVAEYLVPSWLSALRAAEPGAVVSLRMGNSEQVLETIARKDADVGFVEGRAAPPAVESRVVCDDDLVLVVAPGHPWARRRGPVGPEELARVPLVLRERGSGTREVLESALAEHGLAPSAGVELASTTAIKSAVADGGGAAVLGRLAIRAEVADGRLVALATRDLSLTRMIRVVWDPRRALALLARRLLVHIGVDDAARARAGRTAGRRSEDRERAPSTGAAEDPRGARSSARSRALR